MVFTIEIHEVVSMIHGLTNEEVFKVVRILRNGNEEEFQLFRSLPDEKKRKEIGYIFLLTLDCLLSLKLYLARESGYIFCFNKDRIFLGCVHRILFSGYIFLFSYYI